MTKIEEKELVLKDLLGRVLYGVKVDYRGNIFTLGYNLYLNNGDVAFENYPMLYSLDSIESIKPYLRPMSSMTEDEKREYDKLLDDCEEQDWADYNITTLVDSMLFFVIDWLNAHHFDYRGLIPMGLALGASEGVYNN